MTRRRSSESWVLTLTVAECRRRGWDPRIVTWTERYPRRSRSGKTTWLTRTKDLLGCVDALAAAKPSKTVAIQATSRPNVSARVEKLRASSELEWMRAAGWRVLVWGWTQKGKLREVEL